MHIRPARQEEQEALSALALRSKAHWGYDEEFMRACVDALAVRHVCRRPTFVAEISSVVAGFYQLDGPILDSLFIDAPFIGRGIGRALWVHCLSVAEASGLTHFDIASDPFAEGFYLAMGAVRIGEVPSDVVPRSLPLLRYTL